MFDEYKTEVYAEYLRFRESSIVLANPKPSGLRDEALAVCKSGRDGVDVLRFFTKVITRKKEEIGALDIDKFKPVQNFLIGKTNEPTPKVVELVALLIDFQPRPFDVWKTKRVGKEDDRRNSGNANTVTRKIKQPKIPIEFKLHFRLKIGFSAFFFLVVSVLELVYLQNVIAAENMYMK